MGEFRRASQVSSSRLEFDVYFNFPPNVTWADEFRREFLVCVSDRCPAVILRSYNFGGSFRGEIRNVQPAA